MPVKLAMGNISMLPFQGDCLTINDQFGNTILAGLQPNIRKLIIVNLLSIQTIQALPASVQEIVASPKILAQLVANLSYRVETISVQVPADDVYRVKCSLDSLTSALNYKSVYINGKNIKGISTLERKRPLLFKNFSHIANYQTPALDQINQSMHELTVELPRKRLQ